MGITFHHVHHFPCEDGNLLAAIAKLLKAQECRIVSKVADDINASLDKLTDAVNKKNQKAIDDAAAAAAKIAELQALLDAGGATAEEEAAIQARIDALIPLVDAGNPTSPTTIPTP